MFPEARSWLGLDPGQPGFLQRPEALPPQPSQKFRELRSGVAFQEIALCFN